MISLVLDASGKPGAGIMEGSMTMFGNYRQCLKVRAPDDDEIEFTGEFSEYFRGQYCVLQLKPWLPKKQRFYNFNTKLAALVSGSENEWYEKTVSDEMSELALAFNYVNIRFDVCVPSLCPVEDIQKAASYISERIDLKIKVLRCEQDIDAINRRYDIFQIGWALLPMVLVSIVLLASVLTISLLQETEKPHLIKSILRSLSLGRSIECHTKVDYEELSNQKPLALYGLKFLFIMWFIIVESTVNLKFEYLRELMLLKDLINWWPVEFIINSTLQYDSLILLTAFTLAYQNIDSNMKTLVKYTVDKYVRLMPSVMVVTAFVILLPLAYKGPVWNDYVANQSEVCQHNGWINALFIQNLLPYNKMVSALISIEWSVVYDT